MQKHLVYLLIALMLSTYAPMRRTLLAEIRVATESQPTPESREETEPQSDLRNTLRRRELMLSISRVVILREAKEWPPSPEWGHGVVPGLSCSHCWSNGLRAPLRL
ncbi:MAG: hypothetical protein ACK5Q5_06840 [Planctomycetaceae bacterium]